MQVIQPNDSAMSCSQMRQEIQISNQSLSRLVGDQKAVESNNVAAVAAGALIFFPALFFMNLKGAAREEAKALQDRINGLAERHNAKGCKPAITIMTAEQAKATAETAKPEAKPKG